MDFFNRNTQPAAHGERPAQKAKHPFSLSGRVLKIAGLVAVVLIIAWLTLTVYKGNESRYVNGNQYQAVFLNNNQVYFGKISDLNKKFMVLTDVFYIETPSQTQASPNPTGSNYTLRKLGTNELHSPEDEMIINREQVTFWENIKDSSQVVTKIKEYKANPTDASQNSGDSVDSQSDTTSP